jgi:hypothetical protein
LRLWKTDLIDKPRNYASGINRQGWTSFELFLDISKADLRRILVLCLSNFLSIRVLLSHSQSWHRVKKLRLLLSPNPASYSPIACALRIAVRPAGPPLSTCLLYVSVLSLSTRSSVLLVCFIFESIKEFGLKGMSLRTVYLEPSERETPTILLQPQREPWR